MSTTTIVSPTPVLYDESRPPRRGRLPGPVFRADEDELCHRLAPILLLGAIPKVSPVSKTARFHEIRSAIHSASVAIASSSRDPAARWMMTSAVTSPSSSPGGGLHA
jgi:hypothetical protein